MFTNKRCLRGGAGPLSAIASGRFAAAAAPPVFPLPLPLQFSFLPPLTEKFMPQLVS